MQKWPDGTTGYYTTANAMTGGITAGTDHVKFEYVRMNTTSNIDANGYTFTLGRGIVNANANGNAYLYGINTNKSFSQVLTVESGNYNDFRHINVGISATNTINQLVILGCDYDRARANTAADDDNTDPYSNKLRMDNMIVAASQALNRTAGELYVRSLVKSGNFIRHIDATHNTSYRGRSRTENYYINSSENYGQRALWVEGGHFVGGITGGSDNANQEGMRAYSLRVRGNARIDGLLAGAASQNSSGGDRCLVFTGGTVGGWICCGANGTNDANPGRTIGTSYLYFGGNAECNSHLHTNSPHTMGHSYGGNIFGAGCGISNASTSGSMEHGTNVVLADNAYIEHGLYGGGAYGYTSDYTTPTNEVTANIYILGGEVAGITGTNDVGETLHGGVFGGASQNRGSSSNIIMYDGLVKGGIYGGSNNAGTMLHNTSIRIYGGQVGTPDSLSSIYGGGYGASTGVTGNVDVTLKDTTNLLGGAVVYGDVYGGSCEGDVNGTTNTSTKHTNVTAYKGTIHGSVFGSGYGEDATVFGNVLVTIGDPTLTSFDNNLVIDESVFGGGNEASYNSTGKTFQVIMSNGLVKKYVFGGGKGLVGNNNLGKITGNTNVIIQKYSRVGKDVFGGGNAGEVTGNTNVQIKQQ